MRMIQSLLMCAVILGLWLPSVSLAIEEAGAKATAQDVQRLWERHWRVYAQRCAQFEDEFICAPGFDKRYPSSAGVTVRQVEAKLSEKIKVGGHGVVMTKTVRPPIAEAQAVALPIPKIKIGEYGFLASAEVVEVLGPKSMVVEDLYLIDPAVYKKDYRADRAKARQAEDSDAAEASLAYIYTHRDALIERQKDKRHKRIVLRLEGYPTQGLTEGDRWAGPKGQGFSVLIAHSEYYGSKRRQKQRAVAVAVDQIKWGLDEQTFVSLLEARGLTRQSFVSLVMEKMAEGDPETAEQQVFAALLPVLEDPPNDEDEPDQALEDVDEGSSAEEGDAGIDADDNDAESE